MNKSLQTHLVSAASVILPGVALLIAWAAVQKSVLLNDALFGFSLLSIVLVAGGVGASIVLARGAREHYFARRAFERLIRLDDEALHAAATPSQLSGLSADSLWHTIYGELRSRLAEQSERLSEAKMTRTGLELKARRFEDKLIDIEHILSGISEPVLACDEYGDVIVANQAAQKLLGFDLETADTRMLRELSDCEAVLDLMEDTKRRRVASQRVSELELVDAAQKSRWYRVTVNQLTGGEDGAEVEGARVVAFFRDISVEKQIQKRNAEFVSAASHEMKTPLAGIKAYVELLADGDAEDEETQEEFLEVINGQADRLQRLVENLLNIARIEAGVVTVSKESQSLNEILEEAYNLVLPSAEAKQISLVFDLSPMYLSVHVDRDMILQAAINLLSNAVKYTPPGQTVTLRSRTEGLDVLFEVEDTGVGLSEEDQRKVFEKFYRVKKDKNMASGTGLGLPLAKHIVEDVHGGQISVASIEGQGSTFRIQLPAAAKVSAPVAVSV